MPESFALLRYRKMILKRHSPYLRSQIHTSSEIEKRFRKVEITLFAGRPVKRTKRKFNLLMPGRGLELSRTKSESAIYQIGAADGNIKKRTLTCRTIMGDSRLVHMSDIVKLMTVYDFTSSDRPHHIVFDKTVRIRSVIETERPGRVEVAVRLLRFGDFRNQFIQITIQLRVGMCRQGI